MRNLRITGIIALVACMAFTATAFAQEAPVVPAKQPKEKLMIYDGESLKVQLYGFVKLDVVSNSTDVVSESGPLSVVNDRIFFWPYNVGGGAIAAPPDNYTPLVHIKKCPSMRSGSLVFDARTSRLGLKINGPESQWGNTSAVVEADFWGGHPDSGTASRQGLVRMRHAYGKVDWSTGTSLLVGQHWTVNMPLYALASTATFIPWGANGLLFMREPQIALMQKLGVEKYNVLIEASIARVQAGNDAGGTTALYPGVKSAGLDDRGAGEASKIPGFRGRVSFNMKPIDILAVTVGAMGHYQLEKQEMNYGRLSLLTGMAVDPTAASLIKIGKMVNSYSYGAFTKVQVSLVTLVASGFMGWNMDTFLSGLGEGAVVNTAGTKLVPVPTKGGYAQVQVDFRKISPIPIELATGIGGEFKKNNKLIANGKMLSNKTISGTVTFHLNQYMAFIFEVAKHESKYKGVLGSAENMRYQGSAVVNF